MQEAALAEALPSVINNGEKNIPPMQQTKGQRIDKIIVRRRL